jgi:hypothetical protein
MKQSRAAVHQFTNSMSESPQHKRSRLTKDGACCWSREKALSQACLHCIHEHVTELSSHQTLSEAVELLHSGSSSVVGGDCTACLSHVLQIFPHENFGSLQEDEGVRAMLKARCSTCMAAFVDALSERLLESLTLYALLEVAVVEDQKLLASEPAPCQHVQLLVAVLATVVEPARVHAMVMYIMVVYECSSGLKWFLNLLSQHDALPQSYELEYHPLYYACECGGSIEICSALLGAGMDPCELNADERSVLHAAADAWSDPKRAKRSEIASALLQAAAQRTAASSTVQQLLLAVNSRKQTAVHLAVWRCDAELLTVLLDAAAAAAGEPVAAALLAATDSQGLIPVLQAVTWYGNDTSSTEVFRVLVAAAVSAGCLSEVLQATDVAGASIVQLLQRKGYAQWLSMLSDSGVQVSGTTVSALCCATFYAL